MADKKISQLTALLGANAVAADELVIVDVNDTTMSSSGTTKKIVLSEMQAAPYSAGTANGVAYLNGSKVLTTGSALTFDAFGQFCVGGSPNGARFGVTDGSTARLNISPASTQVIISARNNAVTGYVPLTIDGILTVFNASGSEQMRLTSTGLGIGTSSPAYRLDIAGSNNTRAFNIAGATTGYTFAKIANSGGELIFGVGDASSGALFANMIANAAVIGTGISKPLQFATNDSVKATLDSSGNLGLGVTPSAWTTGFGIKVMEIGTRASVYGSTFDANLALNGFFNGSSQWIYKFSEAASRYAQNVGQHQWFTAPSGTAGNAISFSQVMTLDASGNLGIGTSSPASKLDVSSTGDTQTRVISGATNLAFTRFTNGAQVTQVGQENSTGGSLAVGTSAYASIFGTNSAYSLQLVTNNTVRATLDSSGNLLVGLASATGVAKLQVSGPIQTTGYTVATLPAGTVGMRTYVTDALAPSFGVAVAGSGAVTIPVFYDGANWIVA